MLALEGYRVTAVSRSQDKSRLVHALDLSQLEHVKHFIGLHGPFDVVIHCAAIAHGEKPPGGWSVAAYNSKLLCNLLRAFEGEQPHWIFMSSVSVYGQGNRDGVLPITTNPRPVDDYAKGKLFDEQLLRKSCVQLDILRLAPVYDIDHLTDLMKRVFIPKTRIMIEIVPSPAYTFCDIAVVGHLVMARVSDGRGRYLHQVGDSSLTSQHDLVKLFADRSFAGRSIVVPRKLILLLASMCPPGLPGFSVVRMLLLKLGGDTTYQIGAKPL